MAHVEKRRRNGRVTYRARWRDPAGKERSKTFTRKLDADRFLLSIEDAKLRGAYVDPAAGRAPFATWAERWYKATAHLKPSTRHDYRELLDHHVLPKFHNYPWPVLTRSRCGNGSGGLVEGGPIGQARPEGAGRGLAVLGAASREGARRQRRCRLKRLPVAQQHESCSWTPARSSSSPPRWTSAGACWCCSAPTPGCGPARSWRSG
jgi:hypothetical protein